MFRILNKNKNKKKINLYILILVIFIFPVSYTYAALSCSITTQSACSPGIVMLRMSNSTNAHSELPSQSTSIYNNNVVCCTGVTGLSNSCANTNKQIFARLSGVTNAHVEINSQSNPNYTQNACLSSTYAGDQITVGYQTSNCTGYDTTLFSTGNPLTNSQVGIPTAYNNKVCAKIVSQSLSFNITHNSAGFGLLTTGGLRYATSDGLGSNSETEAYAMNASTNASSGYTIYVSGSTLSNGIYSIDAIGGTNLTPTPGTKAFGLRAVASGGLGAVVSPYDGAGFAYNATGTTMSTIAGESSGNGVNTNYSVRTVATIDSVLNYGSYSTNLTYVIVPNY